MTVRPEAVGPSKAAKLLDVSEKTILRLIHQKKLRAIRVGRSWRILLSDLRKGTGQQPSHTDETGQTRPEQDARGHTLDV